MGHPIHHKFKFILNSTGIPNIQWLVVLTPPNNSKPVKKNTLGGSRFKNLITYDRSFSCPSFFFFFFLQAIVMSIWSQDKIKRSKWRTLKNGFLGETRGTITYNYLVGMCKGTMLGPAFNFNPKIWRPSAAMNAMSSIVAENWMNVRWALNEMPAIPCRNLMRFWAGVVWTLWVICPFQIESYCGLLKLSRGPRPKARKLSHVSSPLSHPSNI